MANTSLHFKLRGHLTTEDLVDALSEKFGVQWVLQHYALKTYYDSFDWRLYSANLLCEFNQSKIGSVLTLRDYKTDRLVAVSKVDHVPSFPSGFENAKISKLIAPILDMRALLPITTLDYTHYKLHLLNKDDKTVLRMTLQAYDLIPNRVNLEPVKGYEKALAQASKILLKLGLKQTDNSVLVDALKIQGRKPNDYSSKLKIELAPDIRSDVAVKYIFSHLLKAVKLNEQGTIAATDSEFLHDFRVAVRRTRSGLSQLKGVLPKEKASRFSQYFSWLGQSTNLTRDLDVYILKFKDYQNCLPVTLRKDLEPLYDFLLDKQKQAHENLAAKLKSPDYVARLIEWETFLKTPAIKKPVEPYADYPVKILADHRIWKVYQRIINHGNRIDDTSPPQDLHDLRKTCKKLRYLMEFFQSLYPADEIKILIKRLKDLQEILGDYQDLEVQEQTLKRFSEEMMQNRITAQTFLAMGVLIQTLDKQRCAARQAFASKFQAFAQESIKTEFEMLFKSHEAVSLEP